ncbi:alpha/beta hydrolase [Luteimonas aquatica]|uniref:alpha/beta hydrolase n=1 Tax=Luteimonas aquatica TaxID=450364 RepID=UPI001F5A0DCC|nr:alpha/beta hydrolase [Luteimonas aquatica]
MLRFLALLAAFALALYLAACWWVYRHQRSLLYFPQITRADAAATDFALDRGGIVLRGWALDPDGGSPILYFGGNGERIEHNRDSFAQWFPGSSVYLLAYRGYGASDGTPSEAALFADALALYDHVSARHPGQPVRVIGRSLGSGVASYLASQRPVDRLALVTPYDSIEAVAAAHYAWLPVRRLIQDRYASTTYLRGYAGPVLVLRGGRDEVIAPARTDRLIAALPKPPQVVAIADAGHDDISGFPAYGQALARFMR